MTEFSPREIVSELDRFIVGHVEAKRAVAVALRNRWRRQRAPDNIRDEITPKNILMIGPTGVGKTEIARRLARLAQAPFLKVEATKFTEVGYVGRDVDQIMRDLVDQALAMVRDKRRGAVKARAEAAAEERILDALVGPGAGPATRDSFRKRLRASELDDKEVELTLADAGQPFQGFEIPGQPGASMGVLNLSDMMSKAFGQRTKVHKTTVAGAYAPLIAEESDKLLDQEALTQEALQLAETSGIVFIDELDKVASRAERGGADVSREGVQRDLLPLIEGTTVSTKYGPVKSDHVLFIASGAFHVAKPSDLLPELQGRLPIRVELKALTRDDFRRILTEPEANLIRQNQALMATEGVTLTFSEDAIDALADAAVAVNGAVENIGARRLQTVLEKVVEEISFNAGDRAGETVAIDGAYVRERVEALSQNADLSRFILGATAPAARPPCAAGAIRSFMGAMNVELAEERVLVLPDPSTMEAAEARAWAKRVDAFGALARMSGLLGKPKEDEFELVYKERRLQPFWRLAATATYAYERQRTYAVKVAGEVASVAVGGESKVVSAGAFSITGLESCREETRKEFYYDGLSKEPRADLAGYVKFEGETATPDELAQIAKTGTIVVPPEAKSSMIVREVVAAMLSKIDADRVLEETVRIERVDLYYRPVYAFRYRRQGKEAVVEYDALTGVCKPGGATFETYLGKILEPKFLFDMTVETANIFFPGATLARVIVNKSLEFKKR